MEQIFRDVKWFTYGLTRSLEYRLSTQAYLSQVIMVCQSEDGQMVRCGDYGYPIMTSGEHWLGINTFRERDRRPFLPPFWQTPVIHQDSVVIAGQAAILWKWIETVDREGVAHERWA